MFLRSLISRHSSVRRCPPQQVQLDGDWLSNTAETIFFPVKGFLNPQQRKDIDLLPIGDERYRFCRFPAEHWRATEAQVKALTNDTRDFRWCAHSELAEMYVY